jgi:ataxia telangiectasia mutated family protein
MACRQSVIATVLHLRQFTPVKSDALSYNKWLNLDYRLLAKNAVLCGAYTTALLFLELDVDYPQRPEDVTPSDELLFEIYSHIDEPDGFYGIKTNDLQYFLVRRYHHEKQWEKALQYHGATFESEPNNITGSDGLLQSFSSFGFSHLVMNTLRTTRSTSSSALDYRLGWRAETWDLPERKGYSAGSSLYFSLRAIYRERNTRVIDSVIRKGSSRTMDRLRTLGAENMAEIREVVQEIMCLKQANDWRKSESRLRNVPRMQDEWSDFVSIDPRFE